METESALHAAYQEFEAQHANSKAANEFAAKVFDVQHFS